MDDRRKQKDAFGTALERARRQAGMTQQQVADRISVLNTAISSYEKGNSEPKPEQAIMIEQVLGVEPGSLTHHLGYVPLDTADVRVEGTEEAIIADGRLSGHHKRIIMQLVEELSGET